MKNTRVTLFIAVLAAAAFPFPPLPGLLAAGGARQEPAVKTTWTVTDNSKSFF
jgi:hypothetical protein